MKKINQLSHVIAVIEGLAAILDDAVMATQLRVCLQDLIRRYIPHMPPLNDVEKRAVETFGIAKTTHAYSQRVECAFRVAHQKVRQYVENQEKCDLRASYAEKSGVSNDGDLKC